MNKRVYSVAIVIPIYNEELSQFEIVSLKNNLDKLQNHQIVFVTPQTLILTNVLQNVPSFNGSYLQERFPDQMFSSLMSYNQLMLSHVLYQRFHQYDFILIAQLDTYIFRDELIDWCEKGFDYIGAPWFEGYQDGSDSAPILANSGNGGLSLRNISSFLRVTEPKFRPVPSETWDDLWKKYRNMSIWSKAIRLQRIINRLLKPSGWYSNVLTNPTMNEDEFFANVVPRVFKWFRVASGGEAIPFSFDSQPKRLFELNNGKLPFGCHAWWRYDLEFWNKYINH